MLELVCLLITTGSGAVLRYEGVNRSHEPVFVAHLVRDVTFKQHPNSAYASLSADGERLNLILGTSPLPPDEEVEFGVPALYVTLLPGAHITGEIRLAVPVDEWDGYHVVSADVSSELVSVSKISLSISVIPQSKATAIEAAAAAPGHWLVSGQPVPATCLVTAKAPVPVRKRHDNLPRL